MAAYDCFHTSSFHDLFASASMTFSRPRAKGRRPSNKGKRELANLESSVNYGIASASSRRRKGKTSV